MVAETFGTLFVVLLILENKIREGTNCPVDLGERAARMGARLIGKKMTLRSHVVIVILLWSPQSLCKYKINEFNFI
jgi:hypothetical protein